MNSARAHDRALLAPLALFMVGHGLLETARDALFLSRVSAAHLPWAYLAIALLALPLARVAERLGQRRPGGALLPAALGLAAAGTAAIWLLSVRAPSFGIYGLYVWTGVIATVVVVAYWAWLAERVATERTAAVYARATTGAIAGVAVGSGLAAGIVGWLEPRHLLLAAAVSFVLATAASARWSGAVVPAPERPAPFRSLPRRRAVRALALVVLTGAIALSVTDVLFKMVVAQQVPSPELGRFFAGFYGIVNVIALVVQLVVTPRLVRRHAAATLPLPAVLIAGALSFALLPVLGVLTLLKLSEAALRHSLHRTGVEVMFLSLPDAVRRPARRLIESAAQRGGQALGALAVLAALALGAEPAQIALLIATLATLWLLAVVQAARGS